MNKPKEYTDKEIRDAYIKALKDAIRKDNDETRQ